MEGQKQLTTYMPYLTLLNSDASQGVFHCVISHVMSFFIVFYVLIVSYPFKDLRQTQSCASNRTKGFKGWWRYFKLF